MYIGFHVDTPEIKWYYCVIRKEDISTKNQK